MNDPLSIQEVTRAHMVELIMARVGRHQPQPKAYRTMLAALSIEQLRIRLEKVEGRFQIPLSTFHVEPSRAVRIIKESILRKLMRRLNLPRPAGAPVSAAGLVPDPASRVLEAITH